MKSSDLRSGLQAGWHRLGASIKKRLGVLTFGFVVGSATLVGITYDLDTDVASINVQTKGGVQK